jgi:hypothetical protein
LLNVFDGVDLMSALDTQVGGNHYKDLKIQPVEYMHANKIPFIEGCIIKYATRWRDKGGIADLEKIKHFAQLLIDLESATGCKPTPVQPSPASAEKIKAAEVADNDGWIEWAGGECPVEDGPTYELKFGDGETALDDDPGDYAWNLAAAGHSDDVVVAYRIHKAGE